MTSQPNTRAHLSRLAIAGAFLLTGLAGATQAASAHGPLADNGGSGGGGSVATTPIFLEEFGLVPTNGGPDSFSMHPELDGPTLVGSGPEREIVANSDRQETAGTLDETQRSLELAKIQGGVHVAAGTLSDADIAAIISASGGNGQAIFATDSTLDETARANDLIALSQAPTNDTAAALHGQPY